MAVYFTILALTGGVSGVITLPYFRNTFPNGEYVYMLVWGCALAGRAIGGGIHYKTSIPAEKRYAAALFVYVFNAVGEAFYLFFPVPAMMLVCLSIGIGGVTSYTIRISATQGYVPDEKKGRFNGAFNMLSTIGALAGEFTAGILSESFPERTVLLASMLLCALAAVIFMGGGRKHVAAIYNRAE